MVVHSKEYTRLTDYTKRVNDKPSDWYRKELTFVTMFQQKKLRNYSPEEVAAELESKAKSYGQLIEEHLTELKLKSTEYA